MTDLHFPKGSPAAAALPEVRGLIRALKSHGFKPASVDDGGEIIRTTTEAAMLEAIFSVDQSHATFRREDGTCGGTVLLILMNGDECVTDYSMGDPMFALAIEGMEA